MFPHETDAPTPFRRVTDVLSVAPQISADDVAAAAKLGVKVLINNRPDGEEPGQPTGAEIKAAAEAAGLAYVEIPVDRSGLSPDHLDAWDAAGEAPALAYCRSGTRSITLWAHAAARRGMDIDEIISLASNAGYDLRGHRATFEMLAKAR